MHVPLEQILHFYLGWALLWLPLPGTWHENPQRHASESHGWGAEVFGPHGVSAGLLWLNPYWWLGRRPFLNIVAPYCQLLWFFGSQALDRSIRTSLGGLQCTFSLHPPQKLQVKSLTYPFDWVVRWLTISSFALTMAYWVVMWLDGLDFFHQTAFGLMAYKFY